MLDHIGSASCGDSMTRCFAANHSWFGGDAIVDGLLFPVLTKIDNSKLLRCQFCRALTTVYQNTYSTICAVNELLSFRVPAEAKNGFRFLGAGLGALPARMRSSCPACLWERMLSYFPDQDFVARRSGDESTIGRYGEANNRKRHGHQAFRPYLGAAYVPYTNCTVLTRRS